MYTYFVFSVKAEVAAKYFYKSGILYRFLKQYREGPAYKHLQLQYDYIIEPLDLLKTGNYLKSLNRDVEIERRDEYLKLHWDDKILNIYKDSRHFDVTCSSIEDVEDLLFSALRKSQGYFFVINNRFEDYGWLSIKRNRVLGNELFSSLS